MENKTNGKAVASLILGIFSCFFIFTGSKSFLGIILAVIGLILGINAKKEEPNNGTAKAGVVLSIIALILCAITFVACVACLGAVGCASMMQS